MRLLVVEDEKKLAAYLRRAFREEGLAVEKVHDGEEALALAQPARRRDQARPRSARRAA